MDDDSLSGLLTIFVLIAIHAFLALARAALANVRISIVREMAEDGNRRAQRVLFLTTSTSLPTTFQLLTTLIRFAIAAVAVLDVADPIITANPAFSSALVYGITLFLVAFVTVVLADIVPEAIGSAYANTLALWLAGVIRLLVLALSPLVAIVLQLSKVLSSIFRSGALVNIITEEEIMTLVDAGHSGGTIEEEEKEMIYSVLQLDQTRVSEVMVPRIDVVAVEINQSLEEAGEIFIQSGFSRIPVFEDNIDKIEGLLYAKDLLACWKNGEGQAKGIHDLMRPAYFVPETKRADELLKELQSQKVHLAIVVDEYGGTAGLVTIENVIEEIIGDIQDEYDIHEEAEYEQVGPDEYTVDASIDLDDFNEMLEVDLPTEDIETLGGYIYAYFGRVPVEGETIETDDLIMNVQFVEGRRIRKVHILRKRKPVEDDELAEDSDSTDETEEISTAG